MTTTSTDSPRPLRADARRNRERILASAREVFAEHGTDAQIDDVAKVAGVGVGTVYRHFPTKEALMVEIVRQKHWLWIENARAALADEQREPFEALADLLRANVEICAPDSIILHALSGGADEIWAQAADEQRELLGLTDQLVQRAQRAGTMRDGVEGIDIAMLMCGVSATAAHSAPGFDWRRHLELVISMLRA